MLLGIFAALGLLCLALAQLPRLDRFVSLVFTVMALLGMANGAVFQLVSQRFSQEIGIVTGVVGATGALGGFFLPPLLGLSKDFSGSYGAGLALFGLVCFVCANIALRAQKVWNGAAVTVPDPSSE